MLFVVGALARRVSYFAHSSDLLIHCADGVNVFGCLVLYLMGVCLLLCVGRDLCDKDRKETLLLAADFKTHMAKTRGLYFDEAAQCVVNYSKSSEREVLYVQSKQRALCF